MNRLALVAWGDPTQRQAWSGTAKAVMDALTEKGLSVVPINAKPPRLLLAAAGRCWPLLAWCTVWKVTGATGDADR